MNPFDSDTYEDTLFESVTCNDDLEGVEFYNCVFKNSSLQSSRLRECCFDSCEFICSNLSLIKIQQTAFLGTKFTDCKMIGVSWSSVSGLLSAEFNNCDLNNNIFSDMNLTRFRFTSCSFSGASFYNTKLTYAAFDDCEMRTCQFSQSDLSHADLRTSRNYFVNATANTLHKTKVSLPEAAALLENLDIILE